MLAFFLLFGIGCFEKDTQSGDAVLVETTPDCTPIEFPQGGGSYTYDTYSECINASDAYLMTLSSEIGDELRLCYEECAAETGVIDMNDPANEECKEACDILHEERIYENGNLYNDFINHCDECFL